MNSAVNESPLLLVALDGLADNKEKTMGTAAHLSDDITGNFGFKVNLDFLLDAEIGLRELLAPIQQFGRPLFADIKMWNGKRTMASVIETLVALNIDYVNVYALADGQISDTIRRITNGTRTKVLGLTVLTHYDDAYCQKHFRRSLSETVRHFAEVAVAAGCHGIILPGTMLPNVADIHTIKLVPGIRPPDYRDKRHHQEVTARYATLCGADILVCGSPIMKNPDPAQALQQILRDISSATAS